MISSTKTTTFSSQSPNEGIITRILRLGVKFAQLLTSLFLTISMYYIGPYWIFIAVSLVIPLYGLFLIYRSPEHLLKNHPLPYIRFKALERARRWIRVDLAISITMAIISLLLSIILFIGYIVEHLNNIFILSAAASSLFLSLLYFLNILLSVRNLQIGRINLINEKNKCQQSPKISTTWPSIILPSSNNNIYENEEENNLNWRQIPIKQRSSFSEENKNIIEEENEEEHCIKFEKRQRTPSGENIAMIFERQKSYKQKEKNQKEEEDNGEEHWLPSINYDNNLTNTENKYYINKYNNDNKLKQPSPIRRRKRYQTSSSLKTLEERELSPSKSITIERASSSPPYQHNFNQFKINSTSQNELNSISPTSSYWQHQVTEL